MQRLLLRPLFIWGIVVSAERVQIFNTDCTEMTTLERASIMKEIKDYELNARFDNKIQEVRGLRRPDPRQRSIVSYLSRHALKKDMSVLDLGCAAGNPLRLISDELMRLGGYGNLTGIELVPGWVSAGNQVLMNRAQIIEGDATSFSLGVPPPQYDLVMMNDVLEHVMTNRYACLFKSISVHASKAGSFVYFHIPSPLTQLHDSGQYFENIVPPHVIIHGLATFGYEIYHLEQDFDTMKKGKTIMNQGGTPKYLHMLFRKASSSQVFLSSQKEHR